jgi:hypothetical protein
MGFASLYPSYGPPDGQISSPLLHSEEPAGSQDRMRGKANLPSGINRVGSFKFRAQKYSSFHLSEIVDF